MYITMIIHKITPSIDYNWWLKRLDTQLVEPTNPNLFKVFKIIKTTNKKICYCKTLGISAINSPMSPPSLTMYTI